MGKLYIVPTPIGNLEDITFRAVRILGEVDAILCEDTRQTKKLLDHYQIDKKTFAFHKENEHRLLPTVISRLQAGDTLALVSDAGTPGISDPGFLLSRACVENSISVECLPGATAFIPALLDSGFPLDRFVFEGFLPHKKGRQTRLKQLAVQDCTAVLYESPHRLVKLLDELKTFCGEERMVCVCRELTKFYEEIKIGTTTEVHAYFSAKEVKGEIVVVIKAAE